MPADFRVVIPARYASTRFPGKALAELDGWPMIRHVWARACRSGAREVIVATDDERIAAAARGFGAEVAFTSAHHASGTERTAEVARARGWDGGSIVVNCQGDVPLVSPESLAQAAALLAAHSSAAIATLAAPVTAREDYLSPHVVKVVCDAAGRALYFSRAPIPAVAHGMPEAANHAVPPETLRHIGIYAYRVNALLSLADAPPCRLEAIEKLEQLRALWLGLEIRVATAVAEHGPDVDTPEDMERVRQFAAGRTAQG